MGKSGYSRLIWNNVHVAAFRLQQKSKHDMMINILLMLKSSSIIRWYLLHAQYMTGINNGHFVIHISSYSLFNTIKNQNSSLPWKNLIIHFKQKKKHNTEKISKVENISKHLKLILCCQLHLQIPP